MNTEKEIVLTKVVGNDWCDYRLAKSKYNNKWTYPMLEYNDFRGTGNNEWGVVELFEHFSIGDIEYLKKEFGMDFELGRYYGSKEELIQTKELVQFTEDRIYKEEK
tara:strand:+ start:187 stop:504 length:318 start_codon:yes stop_codon:yes gene_type:complete